ncbi:50S ribosomal protein P1 [Salinirubellus sp. GCM10025818]|jgi:large subunit ribosomal protein L12|uniref:50S ribosomal protein P1 n=1 Tax=Salinirubellus TaxID=2162630 RepID=UPI0030CF5209
MEYVYAALVLHESGEELNEENITNVLEAAGVDVEESRVKALVAALEDVDIEEAIETAAAVPAGGSGGAGGADGAAEAEGDEGDDEDDGGDEAEAEADEDEEEEDDSSGEGLGELFG